MDLVLEGIVLGIALMILLGPLFVALTQAAIEGGSRAGMAVAIGIWVSDFTIVGLCYFFVQRISRLVEDHSFTYWMGLSGSFVLITFGIATFLAKSRLDTTQPPLRLSVRDYAGLFTKGFLVNTINPFTFVFWITVTSTYVIGRKISHQEAALFFGTILLVIMVSDTLKVVLAKYIRTKLEGRHINTFSKVAGVALIVFGIVLLFRAEVL